MSKFGVLVMGPAGAGKVSFTRYLSLVLFELICSVDHILYSIDRASTELSSKLLLREP